MEHVYALSSMLKCEIMEYQNCSRFCRVHNLTDLYSSVEQVVQITIGAYFVESIAEQNCCFSIVHASNCVLFSVVK